MRSRSPLREALGLRSRELLSLVGAGGKTTLMFRLAEELSLEGKKVITTTTTKILKPSLKESPSLLIGRDQEKMKQYVRRSIDQDRHITLASERIGSGKLRGISPYLVNELWSSYDMDGLIVEADGAAGRPVKAPRENEPVIPSCTTLVVALLGLDGLGKDLNEENAFQAERISQLTGTPAGSRMTENTMALLMTHPEGLFKGTPSASRRIAFLNKADIPNGVKKGKAIAQRILEEEHPWIERIIVGQLKREPPVMEVFFPFKENISKESG